MLNFSKLRQSEDFLVDELFAGVPASGAPLLCAEFPRAYCDVNREAFELDPHMYSTPLPDYVVTVSPRLASGIGTIPKVVGAGQEIYSEKLDFQEVQTRINECYFPYHHALRQLLEEGLKRFGYIYLLDCHSMPSAKTRSAPDNRRPDIILGNRYGTSCAPGLFSSALARLQSFGYQTGQNTPYAGGFITTHYGKPEKNIHALQIEINRNLYMNQKTLTPTAGFVKLQEDISKFTQDMGRYDSSLLSA